MSKVNGGSSDASKSISVVKKISYGNLSNQAEVRVLVLYTGRKCKRFINKSHLLVLEWFWYL